MKPSSQRRINASRRNGLLSKGPLTPESKARSARNSLKHGLTAKTVVVLAEKEEGFREMMSGFSERFQPGDEIDYSLVEEIASATWRIRRIWAMETCAINSALQKEPATDSPMVRLTNAVESVYSTHHSSLLHRYETHLHTTRQRAINNYLLIREASLQNDARTIIEHQPALAPPAADLTLEISPLPAEPYNQTS